MKTFVIESEGLGLNLQGLTGHESGIVVYSNNEGIICNWCGIDGLPKVFATGLLSINSSILPDVESVTSVDDIRPALEDVNLIYMDMTSEQFEEDFSVPVPAKKYLFEDGTIVYVPDNWQ
jgi:hypothetical protein